ncbi:MAG: hypothetical protein NC228_02455 [[Eubacterium] siraeum]|nr:hypothetical protein [[Eubacterium] siraeum]
MGRFAVIDTETTWSDEVMSVGAVVADSNDFSLIDKRYYILTPFKNHGGMFSCALYANGTKPDLEGSREQAMADLRRFLDEYGVLSMFAYNAAFDYRHLVELHYLRWFDIMKLAAYRQYNPKIPESAQCYGTGRLKRGYGVESIYRMLSGDFGYYELHNALTDAVDELEIMRLLSIDTDAYAVARIG